MYIIFIIGYNCLSIAGFSKQGQFYLVGVGGAVLKFWAILKL